MYKLLKLVKSGNWLKGVYFEILGNKKSIEFGFFFIYLPEIT